MRSGLSQASLKEQDDHEIRLWVLISGKAHEWTRSPSSTDTTRVVGWEMLELTSNNAMLICNCITASHAVRWTTGS